MLFLTPRQQFQNSEGNFEFAQIKRNMKQTGRRKTDTFSLL